MPDHKETAKKAIDNLRIARLLEEKPKTELAQELGINRMTIARRLKSEDVMLSDYLAIATALGVDPIENLEKAIVDANEKAADSAAANVK